jgi:hypothetical protein
MAGEDGAAAEPVPPFSTGRKKAGPVRAPLEKTRLAARSLA